MAITQYSTLPHPVTKFDYDRSALQLVARDIWSTTDKWYDVKKGAARYGVGPQGGSIRLQAVFSKGPVNCYDLAAAGQAWCASLGLLGSLPNSKPVIEYCWAFSNEWFGYVSEGPLLGYDGHKMPQTERFQRCNSPFWANPGKEAWYGAADLMNAKRTFFANHAWTEVWLAGQNLSLVFETCHAALGQTVNDVVLAVATDARAAYYANAVNRGHQTMANQHKYDPRLYFRREDGNFYVWLQNTGTWFNNNIGAEKGLIRILD